MRLSRARALVGEVVGIELDRGLLLLRTCAQPELAYSHIYDKLDSFYTRCLQCGKRNCDQCVPSQDIIEIVADRNTLAFLEIVVLARLLVKLQVLRDIVSGVPARIIKKRACLYVRRAAEKVLSRVEPQCRDLYRQALENARGSLVDHVLKVYEALPGEPLRLVTISVTCHRCGARVVARVITDVRRAAAWGHMIALMHLANKHGLIDTVKLACSIKVDFR